MFQIDISNILQSFEICSSKPKLAKYQTNHSLDKDRIRNGMCPEYALAMSFHENSKYWEKDHDWIRGLTPLQSEILNSYNVENNIHMITEFYRNKYDKIPMSDSELQLRKRLEKRMDDFIEDPDTFLEISDSYMIDIRDDVENEWYLEINPHQVYIFDKFHGL
jgi:hypothetical protein